MKSGATLGGKWFYSGETVGGEAEDKTRGEVKRNTAARVLTRGQRARVCARVCVFARVHSARIHPNRRLRRICTAEIKSQTLKKCFSLCNFTLEASRKESMTLLQRRNSRSVVGALLISCTFVAECLSFLC